jgi:hypothetical protein
VLGPEQMAPRQIAIVCSRVRKVGSFQFETVWALVEYLKSI